MRTPALLLMMLLTFAIAPAMGAPVEVDTHAADTHTADTHGEPQLLPTAPSGIPTAITTLLIFAGLVAILGKYAWGPIASGLQAREDKIRNDIVTAEQNRAAAEASLREYEARLAGAEQRVRELMTQAQADGQQLATRIKMQAQTEAEEIKERAMRDIDSARKQAVDDIYAQAATMATGIAGKILQREISEQDQQDLVRNSLEQFKTTSIN